MLLLTTVTGVGVEGIAEVIMLLSIVTKMPPKCQLYHHCSKFNKKCFTVLVNTKVILPWEIKALDDLRHPPELFK